VRERVREKEVGGNDGDDDGEDDASLLFFFSLAIGSKTSLSS